MYFGLAWHLEKYGEVYCLLLLDNCSAHRVLKEQYSRFIIILFLPPRVTSWYQPADMGMIASLKVGYRVKMLDILLSLFDAPGGYESASIARARQPRGMKGFDYGGKAILLDAMKILQPLWDGDKKYAYLDLIARCWQKADILPASWIADINNNVGSQSLSKNLIDTMRRVMFFLSTNPRQSFG